MLGLCENQIKKIGLIWVDKEQFVPKQEGTITLDPIDQLNFELFDGNNNPRGDGYYQSIQNRQLTILIWDM